MKNPSGNNPAIFRLEDRCLIKVSGADAPAFLQDLVTNDVARLAPSQLIYACLLTPQGRFLHDFFISRDGEGFFLECETERRADLLRRLTIFKLRAKVTLEDYHDQFDVYASTSASENQKSFQDPRLPALGYRFYTVKNTLPAAASTSYKDKRISLGVPEGSTEIKPEIDTIADANLDLLQAVSWDKGCFVGQEVAARMHNRGLFKKRLVLVAAPALAIGNLTQDGHGVGEIRAVNAAGTQGLAILKLAALEEPHPLLQADGTVVTAHLPKYL